MRRWLVLLGVTASGAVAPCFGGIYTDDLSRCLVDSTSQDDRSTLVRWIFEAMSQHPTVASLTSVKPADLEEANKAVGALFMRLLTETCLQKAKDAVANEGPPAIQMSFQVLGQVAAGK